MLEMDEALKHWKSKDVDFSNILFKPETGRDTAVRCVESQNYGLDKALDLKLIEMAKAGIENALPVKIELPIRNINRTVGAMLSGEISAKYKEKGLPDDTIQLFFKGSAGQSFGAFGARGVSFYLEGDANDYLGKGLSGSRIVVVPAKESVFKAEENIIVGNTLLYGATAGEVFIRGMAGERFCVRNSGANAVVEGLGDHGCEYMTGGRVVVLGLTGRNFAAGMSGGIAYVWDVDGKFRDRCNLGMVELDAVLNKKDVETIRMFLEKHNSLTSSPVAEAILKNWKEESTRFVKVMPLEYKRVLEQIELKLDQAEIEGEASDG
jgi:glutamate synthase domain-containing protein 3